MLPLSVSVLTVRASLCFLAAFEALRGISQVWMLPLSVSVLTVRASLCFLAAFEALRGISQVWMLPLSVSARTVRAPLCFLAALEALRGISQVSMLPLSVSVLTVRPRSARDASFSLRGVELRGVTQVCTPPGRFPGLGPRWFRGFGRPRHHSVWMLPLSVSVSDSPPVLSLPGALTSFV
jgi:hypothetical protein